MKNHIHDPASTTSLEKEFALREIMQRDRRVLASRALKGDSERRAKISATLKSHTCAEPPRPQPGSIAHA